MVTTSLLFIWLAMLSSGTPVQERPTVRSGMSDQREIVHDSAVRTNDDAVGPQAESSDPIRLRVEYRDDHLVAFSTTGSIRLAVQQEAGLPVGSVDDARGQCAFVVGHLPSGRYVATVTANGERRSLPFTR